MSFKRKIEREILQAENPPYTTKSQSAIQVKHPLEFSSFGIFYIHNEPEEIENGIHHIFALSNPGNRFHMHRMNAMNKRTRSHQPGYGPDGFIAHLNHRIH